MERYEAFRTAYDLSIIKTGDDYNICGSDTLPDWLCLGTSLGQFRDSLIKASKQFDKDIILEIRARNSTLPDTPKED